MIQITHHDLSICTIKLVGYYILLVLVHFLLVCFFFFFFFKQKTAYEMFVLGDVKVIPKLDKRFTPGMPLGVYLQVYNAALDQASGAPSLTVFYRLLQNGKVLAVATDEKGESAQFYSGQRVVLIKELGLEGLERGAYQLQAEVVDHSNNRKVQVGGDFRVAAGDQPR